jgi:CBS domain-containing protein
MARQVHEVMTPGPVTLPLDAPLTEAARLMRDEGIGGVLVTQDGRLCGLLTDRDIVVRAVAAGDDPTTTTVGQVASAEIAFAAPSDSIGDAVALMRQRAVRRLPVVDDGKLVGLVSLGDLAMELDEDSALSDISAAPPNG